KRSDPADVVVVVHLAVGDDVEPGLLLVADHSVRRVVEGLLVLDFLERDPDVAAAELLVEPARPRVGADHRGRQDGVDDRLRHVCPPLAATAAGRDPNPLHSAALAPGAAPAAARP